MSRLFTPIALGGVTLASRIAVSPMFPHSAEDGSANEWHRQHLGALSISGSGLLIVEMTGVEPEGRIGAEIAVPPHYARSRPRLWPAAALAHRRRAAWR